MGYPVITAASTILAHAPGLVRYGSRPLRDIKADPSLLGQIGARLRSYEDAVAYAPNQAYIGNLAPEDLWGLPRPWFNAADGMSNSSGPFGDIIAEPELLSFMRLCDGARLVAMDGSVLGRGAEGLLGRGLATRAELDRLEPATADAVHQPIGTGEAIPLSLDDEIVGSISRGHEEDEALTANVLLENLACKATAVLALRRLLNSVEARLDPSEIEFVISGSEEAVGDRYQRGGGSLSKAIAESAGLTRVTGFDLKAFCASTLYAMFNAAAMIHAGVFSRVVVVAGGSLAKLGMKHRAHLAKEMPVLEDVLAGLAILVEDADADGPRIRLDTLGFHAVNTGSSQQAILEALVSRPLEKAGYGMTDVDRYATEMHNPEVTEPAGSGDVPAGNYRLIAALGVMRGEVPRDGLDEFQATHGMPGFAPTQGHIASAVCYMPHALRALRSGDMSRVLFMAKGSLFLGRMTGLSDGVSFLVEA